MTQQLVAQQYEEHPYPKREHNEMTMMIDSCLEMIEHAGEFDIEDGFCALVAGCGTGDSVLWLAKQFQVYGLKAKVIGVDLSSKSIAVAQSRLDHFKLNEYAELHQGSLLELDKLPIPTQFDYINCVGVLHHLPDPDAGLRALSAVLAPHGVMMIMVYGEIGRTGVYQAQKLLKLILPPDATITEKIATAQNVLLAMPDSNWYKHSEKWFSDIQLFGDAGLRDLLLHPQDRAYTVPQLFKFIRDAKLELAEFLSPAQYQLKTYGLNFKHPRSVEDDAEIAELFSGRIFKHLCYVRHPRKTTRAGSKWVNLIPHTPVPLENVPQDGSVLVGKTDTKIVVQNPLTGMHVELPLDDQLRAIVDPPARILQTMEILRLRLKTWRRELRYNVFTKTPAEWFSVAPAETNPVAKVAE